MTWADDDDVLLLLEGNLNYLIRDEFLAAASAPLTSPRNCEPGPGVLTIGDSGNTLSISGGEIVPTGQSISTSNPGIWHVPGFPRITGRALKVRVKNVSAYGSDVNKTFSPIVAWADVAGSTSIFDFEGIGYWIANSKFQIIDSISATSWTTMEPCFADTYNVFAIILRAGGGAFHIVDGKLIGITRQNADSNVHPEVSGLGGNRNPFQLDYFRVADLGAPWNTDFGICTSALAGARAAADLFTHEGSCHIEFTITTLPASGTVEVRFRKQDSSNYWRCTISSAGAVSIDEVVAGTPTSRCSITGCAANDRMVISMNGATITMYRDRPSTGVTNVTAYASALYPNNTAGEVNSLGTGGAIKDLYTYPYNLSGDTLSAINRL